MSQPEIDTQNDFLFGMSARRLHPLMAVEITTREQAYRTAAWIIEMGSLLPAESETTFDMIHQAVQGT